MAAGMLLAANAFAQPLVKHFTAEDDITAWWVNTNITPGWDTETLANDSTVAVFTADLEGYEGDTLKGFYWVTDLKFENITAEEWTALKDNLHLSFWINPLDGVNAGDSINISSEIVTAEGGKGWPGIKIPTDSGKWLWVSQSLADLSYSGSKPSEIAEANLFKFSPQPALDYVAKAGTSFKYAFQDITLSNGPIAVPAKDPAGNSTSGPGTSVGSVAAKSVKFFPNPAQGSIYFNENVSGQIIDLAGKVLTTFNNANSVDINGIAKGVYFVKTNNNQVEKLIVK